MMKLNLSYVRDNGIWKTNYGSYAVDGIYETHQNGRYYAHHSGFPPPLLVLSIEQTAVVKKVDILLRFQSYDSSSSVYPLSEIILPSFSSLFQISRRKR